VSLSLVIERRVADLQWAVRSLRRAPASSGIAILSLALGIGANTAIFSMINTLLLRRLPVPAPQELRFVVSNPSAPRLSWNYPDYLAFRDGIGIPLAAAAGTQPIGVQVSDAAGEAADLAPNQFVSGNYFTVMGVTAEIGRLFNAAEDRQLGASPYAVLGYDYWRSRFASDPRVVGRTVRVNGYPLAIVGVARRGFRGTDPTTTTGLYVPLTMHSEVSRVPPSIWNTRHYWWIRAIGRVPAGANISSIEARLTNIARAQEDAERRENPRMGVRGQAVTVALMPAARGYTNSRTTLEKPLLVLMAIVALVLLIACSNVANVLLARGAGRGRELAIRMAMGAGRGRIASQLLTESLVMSLAGGAVGILLAWFGAAALIARFIPQAGGGHADIDVSPDLAVLTFTAAVSMATGVLAGLAPAIQASRFVLVPALKADTAGAAGASHALLRRLLVVGQVALSLLLVIGAALFARSLANLESLDPGFERDRLVIAFANPESLGYKGQRLHDFFERLREGVERVPGVTSVSLSSISPLDGTRWNGDFAVEGHQWRQADQRAVDFNSVGPRFFETMGIPVVIGREFLPEDSPAVVPDPPEGLSRDPETALPGPRRAIVNESFARRFLGGSSPLGRRISLTEAFDASRAYEIVGVVGDVRYFGLREALEPMIYVPVWRGMTPSLTLAIRTRGNVAGLAQSIRSVLAGIDVAVPLRDLKTGAEQIDSDIVQDRLVATLASLFGGLALLLAAIGLYGVLAYLAARRTREIGIRLALGASRLNVLWLVTQDAVVMVGVGAAIGLGTAVGAARLVRSLLFGFDAHDPMTAVVATLVLLAAAALAVLVPARRAMAIEPSQALRDE
jgi:putative ABC transport system permease protein